MIVRKTITQIVIDYEDSTFLQTINSSMSVHQRLSIVKTLAILE